MDKGGGNLKSCVSESIHKRDGKTYDHTATEIFGEIEDRFGDRKPLRPARYYGEERSKHGSRKDDEYGPDSQAKASCVAAARAAVDVLVVVPVEERMHVLAAVENHPGLLRAVNNAGRF